MNDIRIAFFDVDGTLSNMKTGRISAKTLECLHRLQARGVRICIATGRGPCLVPQLGDVRADAFLTCSGALCYDADGVIFSNPIPQPDVQRIIRNAAGIGRPVAVLTKERIAANALDADLIQYYAFADWQITAAPDFEAVSRQPVYQVVMSCLAADHAAILAGVENAARLTPTGKNTPAATDKIAPPMRPTTAGFRPVIIPLTIEELRYLS